VSLPLKSVDGHSLPRRVGLKAMNNRASSSPAIIISGSAGSGNRKYQRNRASLAHSRSRQCPSAIGDEGGER